MHEGRARPPSGTRAAQLALGLIIVAQALTGCRMDTLYDPVDTGRTPPEVAIQLPVAGSGTQSGARVPIRVAASDSTGVASVLITVSGVVSESIVFDYTPASASVLADTAVVVPADSIGFLTIGASATNARGTTGQAPPVTLNVTAPPL